MTAVLTMTDVHARYRGTGAPDVQAVQGVSLRLAAGEVLGIAGESGCGKSTLAQIMTLVARPPLDVVSGVMTLGGRQVDLRNLADTADEVRGKAIALLPQGAMNSLNPTRRVADLAYDVIRAHERRVSRGTARRRTGERLELLGLPTRVLDSYPHQLSGGMRQRTVAVVSTLLNPTVLVADEPTSALDVSAQRALLDLLRTLLDKEFISAIVFITHDLPLLSTIADRVAVMHAGQLAEIGPAGDMLGGPRHPYTQALVGTVLVPEPWVRTRRIVGISGGPPDLRQPPAGCRFHPRCPHALQVCREQEPPMVGTPDDHAACWWVHERSRDQAGVK